ncbi:DUF350 domain-containing protein [Ningiella sp. W23]|uniref:DUF350 domain-containing protein n=1 Tax=Ningiella sp. W23 TaxID=3023715 RepID=UPI003757954D
MSQLMHLQPLSGELAIYLAIDMSIVIALLVILRVLSGVYSNTNVAQELGERDNFAFGISIAGRMLSLMIVLSAVVGRHVGLGYEQAAVGILVFGAMGIVLVKLGRYAHDKVVLNRLDKEAFIADKNVSVAIVDAASAVACAIIAKSIIDWAQGTDLNAFIAVFSGVLVVMTVLLFATRLYEYRYAEENQDNSFQKALRMGQLALAIQHSGNLIGIAIAVSAASQLLEYQAQAYVSNVTGWLIVALVLASALMLTTSISKRLVLFGINWKTEVCLQHNVGIASIEAALAIGIALLISQIL